MTVYELMAIAVALALDAFAVAVCVGAMAPRVTARHYVRLCAAFGGFQWIMPLAGFALGLTVREHIEAWDHWVAFALLAFVGLSMIRTGCGKPETCPKDPTVGHTLLALALATSLDALAVGLSFAFLDITVWVPALVIGLVCAALTALGLTLGKVLAGAAVLGTRAAFVGGLVLIAIGLRILAEHGVFAGG